jgi:beta-lactamase class A
MIALEDAFTAAGVTAGFHALDLGSGREIAYRADEPVVPASVFKLPVLLELCRQAADGEIDATRPIEVPVAGRAPGQWGLSAMLDAMSMSLRDLACLMISVSDNAATDGVCEHVGFDKVNATLQRLGLTRTRIDGDCRELFATIYADLGIEDGDEFTLTAEALEKLRILDPARSPHVTTPREITRLLELIWNDAAAPAAACAEARRILATQVWPHRLASGFADDDAVRVSGKTGTLPTIRNEAGVVEYPDGERYAVAVFTHSPSPARKNPAADAVIGRAARIAIDQLRS